MCASGLTSRTADRPATSSDPDPVTTTAASIVPVPPLTADATANCKAVSDSEGSATDEPA